MMPAGLQLFDDAGNVLFDITDRVGRVMGMLRIEAGASGSFVLPELGAGRGFVSFQRDQSFITGAVGQFIGSVPVFTVNGATVSWVSKSQFTTWLGNAVFVQPVGGWLTYGVY